MSTLLDLQKEVSELKKIAAENSKPVLPKGERAPNFVRHLGERGYSFTKAVQLSTGRIGRDDATEEYQISEKLNAVYKSVGGQRSSVNSLLVPIGSNFIPTIDKATEDLVAEVREKSHAGVRGYDPDEERWLRRKALGTTSDVAGGTSLIGYPTMGEFIDLQRNMEAFVKAGASEITLPANARLTLPKLQGGSTAYWVGEAASITNSTQATGQLDLQGKKLGVLTYVNNELFRYAGPTTEAMVRNDMARVAALKADLGMLEGTGGTQIKGLITYTTQSSWTAGSDLLIAHTASTVATDGNTFEAADFYKMAEKLPDEVDASAFLMRRDVFSAVVNRRADAVSAADGKGQFLFNLIRQDGQAPVKVNDIPIIKSSQVSAARSKGAGTDLSYVVCGFFPDWVIGRFGVAELALATQGDTAFAADQTWVRLIQIIDAGPRHPASFVFCDQILRS